MALMDAGADPNFGGRSAKSPLYIAAHDGKLAIVKELIAHGADLNVRYLTGEAISSKYLVSTISPWWCVYMGQEVVQHGLTKSLKLQRKMFDERNIQRNGICSILLRC